MKSQRRLLYSTMHRRFNYIELILTLATTLAQTEKKANNKTHRN